MMKISGLLMSRSMVERPSKRRKKDVASEETVSLKASSKRKQRCQETKSKSSAKRKKKAKGAVAAVEQTPKDFTDLPEPVIHHIMSFLHPKDAARMCALSKKWMAMWKSFPILEFDERHFKKFGKTWDSKMKHAIYQSLLSRKEQKLTIQKFKLFVANEDFVQVFLGDQITEVIDLHVKDLQIIVQPRKGAAVIRFPSAVISGRSIIVLNLSGLNLEIGNEINLPQLQKLCLKSLNISKEMLQRLISGCPLIRDLRIVVCSGLEEIIVSDVTSLRRVDVYKCPGVKSVNINVPTLKSFCFNGMKRVLCDIKLSTCRSLKELVLESPRLTDTMFARDIVEFPSLEKLVLLKCSELKKIHIPCGNLRKVVITKCNKLIEAVIDADNLASLEYKGFNMPISLRNPASLVEVKFSLESPPKGHHGAAVHLKTNRRRLYDLIENLDPSNGLKVITRQDSMLVLQEYIMGRPVPINSIDGMQLHISRRVGKLIDDFLRDARRVEDLFVAAHVGSNFAEEVTTMLKSGKQDPKCCGCFSQKCWRHFLKDVFSMPPRGRSCIFEDDFKKEGKSPQYEVTSLWLKWNEEKGKRRKRESAL